MSEVGYQNLNQLDETSRVIRGGLTFHDKYGIDEHPTLGNCYEFAFRTQVAFKAISDEKEYHYIGYAADHAFNVGSTCSKEMYFVSSDVPYLSAHERDYTDIGNILSASMRDVVKDGQVRDVVAGSINMCVINYSLTQEKQNYIKQKSLFFSDYWLKAMSPSISVMTATHARDALTNYFTFRRGLENKDFEQVRDSLEALRVRTPQVETRPKYNKELNDFKRAIRVMSRQAIISVGDLTGLIESYSEILPPKNAAANIIFADCLRYIGSKRNNVSALHKAREYYSRAGHFSSKHMENPIIKAKFEKASALISDIAMEQQAQLTTF